MYPLRISSENEARVSELVFARDEAHLDGLTRGLPTSDIDVARLQKHKCGLRDRAAAALQPLAEGAVHLARDVKRARLLVRHVVWRMQ